MHAISPKRAWLNPGLVEDDYKWESAPDFRESLLRNIYQSYTDSSSPFSYLDPAFSQHPGAGYWIGSQKASPGRRTQQKLKKLAISIAQRDKVAFKSACRHLSNKVDMLQLLPYHSRAMNRRDLLDKLPSCLKAKQLIKDIIESKNKLVVIPRAVKNWGFQGPVEKENLVVYAPSLGASASLTPASPGGAAILRRLSRVE